MKLRGQILYILGVDVCRLFAGLLTPNDVSKVGSQYSYWYISSHRLQEELSAAWPLEDLNSPAEAD